MILTCPDCATRFTLNPGLLAPAGRRVRCTVCATVWFEKPQDEMPEGRVEPPARPPVVEEIPRSVRPLPDPLALRPAQISVRKPMWAGIAAGVLLGVAVGLVGLWLVAAGRGALVRMWPPVAILFETAGLHVSVPGEGLVFDQVKAALAGTPEAGATLTVTGKIINMTGEQKPLPPMMASVSGVEDPIPREIWPVSLPISHLEAENTFAFTTTRAIQEGDGDQLTLRFSEVTLSDSFSETTSSDSSDSVPEAPQAASIHPEGHSLSPQAPPPHAQAPSPHAAGPSPHVDSPPPHH